MAASGEGDVGTGSGGGGFDDGDGDGDGVVRGVALVAVAGDGPAELDVVGDVVGGEVGLALVGVVDVVSGSDDPRGWQIDASSEHLSLYMSVKRKPRVLTAREAEMMVELVDAWRAHEHRKHIALMSALDSQLSPEDS